MKTKKPFRIHRSSDKQWYATIVANNGQTLFTSELYQERESAINALDALCGIVLQNSPTQDQIARFFDEYMEDPYCGDGVDFAEQLAQKYLSVRDKLMDFIKTIKPTK